MKTGVRGLISVVAVTTACLGAGIAPAHAAPPWQNHCTGEKARPAEKELVVQACQRAWSAAARADDEDRIIIRIGSRYDVVVEANANDADAANAAVSADAADAVRADASAVTAAEAAYSVASLFPSRAATPAAVAARKAARDAANDAHSAESDPMDVVRANAAAASEEKAVEASKAAFEAPELVTIPRIGQTTGNK